jgi:glycosyltransferase involved in cell wall biosynthesis
MTDLLLQSGLRENEERLREGIIATQNRGMTVLRPKEGKPRRRVFYLNSYGMAPAWRSLSEGNPGQHLWGCLELARMGYEVAMPEEPNRNSRFYNYRRQDFKHLAFIRAWLGSRGVLYSAHTVLFWSPLLASLRLLRCPIVTLLYANGENLRFANGYAAVIGMTPAAESRARTLAPKAKVSHLGWGVDLPAYPKLPYEPNWFLSCGKTRRDFAVLAAAASSISAPVRVINADRNSGIIWPSNVRLVVGGGGADWCAVTYQDLVNEHYAGCMAALILLEDDPTERYAAGFTQLLEAMALARPVIVTKAGAITREIDVEKEGCGLFVPPNDPAALAAAMKKIANDPKAAEAMGQRGRELCERRYNILCYAEELHRLFESI